MMKSIIKVFVIALLLTNVCLCKAAEPITGAFGFKLNEVPDAGSVLEKEKDDSGIYTCYVKPSSPNPSFQRYRVMVNPKSLKVFCISAGGDYNTKEAALNEMKSILGKLESKYGPSHPMRDAAVIESGDRYVLISVAERPDKKGSLMVTYCDDKLKNLAEAQAKQAKETEVATEGKLGQIEGAFGFKFGEVFDPNSALEKRPVAAGGFIYVVKPPKPSDAFTDYFLVLTPITHKIVGVWANHMFKDQSEALAKQAELAPILEGKYGKINETDAQKNKVIIKHEDEYISLETRKGQDGEAAVLIKYHSTKLDGVFFQEMKDAAAGKADKSGL